MPWGKKQGKGKWGVGLNRWSHGKVTLEKRLEGGAGISHTGIWEQHSGRGAASAKLQRQKRHACHMQETTRGSVWFKQSEKGGQNGKEVMAGWVT